jgi:hypothetical protein
MKNKTPLPTVTPDLEELLPTPELRAVYEEQLLSVRGAAKSLRPSHFAKPEPK